jgi:hypothetical protein
MIIIFTHTPIKHHNNTRFMENLNPKCDKNIYKKCQIFKLQNENETKNKKSFHVNYIHSILMFISNIEILHAHC